MADEQDRMTEPLGVFSRPEPVVGFGPAELVASLLAVVWVVAVVAYVSLLPATDGRGLLGIVMTLLVVFLPLALIWASVTTLRSVRELRAEAARLQATVEAMRNAYLVNQQTAAAIKPVVEQKIDELTAATKEVTATVTAIKYREDVNTGEKIKTSTLRHSLEVLLPNEAAKIEPIMEEVFGLTNEYWVSFWANDVMYDKRFIFLPETINEKNFIEIPKLGGKGIMIG